MLKSFFGSKLKELNKSVQELSQTLSEPQPKENRINTSNQENYVVSSAVLSKIIELAKDHLNSSILHTSDIPSKKIANVVNIYNINESQIVVLYDTSLLKSGKDGIVLCKDCVCWKHAFGSAMILDFKELVKAGINDTKNTLQIEGNIFDLKKNEFTIFFRKLKELLLFEDPYLNNIYEEYANTSLDEIKHKIKNSEYEIADRDFVNLERIIIDRNKNHLALLNYYGCLIKMEQANFDAADTYLSRLKELQIWETTKIEKLKQILNLKKAQYEFNLLEEQKKSYIQENQFAKAIDLINKQKNFGVVSKEQLDSEIERIESLEIEYIRSLESSVLEKLENEEYTVVLNILDELSEANPNVQYDEYYVLAKIGMYEFDEVEQKITSIQDKDDQLAKKLQQHLQKSKTNVIKTIQEAIHSRNYSLFKMHPSLKYVKDSWGMTPLMHFIVQKDIDGVKLLADTYNPNERNVLGHTALNLVSMDIEDPFISEAYELLDNDLIQMLKKLKSKGAWTKAGNLLIKGVDSINNNVGNFSVMEATANMESKMNNSLSDYQREIENYFNRLLINNHKEYLEHLLHSQQDWNVEYEQLLLEIENIESVIEKLNEDKVRIENTFDDRLNKMKNSKIECILYEAAGIELGKKDEFETTSEFEARKRIKVEELKSNFTENDYIKKQLNIIETEVKVTISNDLKETQMAIQSKKERLNSLENEISYIQYLLNGQFDVSEILGCYYQTYLSKIEIGVYDADLESFDMRVNNEAKKINVPRAIAKDFKMQFADLTPVHKMELVNIDAHERIQHYAVYDFVGGQVAIPFLLSLSPNLVD